MSTFKTGIPLSRNAIVRTSINNEGKYTMKLQD